MWIFALSGTESERCRCNLRSSIGDRHGVHPNRAASPGRDIGRDNVVDDSRKNVTKAAWSVGSHNESRAEAMTAPRLREQCRPGIFFVLTFALLAPPAWGQRLGPLVKDNQQRSTASSAESTAAAVQPPSLQLSLPAPAVATLPPVGPDDLQRLQPQEGRPPVIGVHRRLPPGAVTQSFSGGAVKTTAEGAWQSTAVGRLWRLKTTSPSARAMRIHFRDFAIGAGSLWLHSPSGQFVGPYSGSGLYGDGDFWSGIVSGDSLTIEYLPDPVAAEEAVPFQIVEISHIWDDAFGGDWEADVQPPIAAPGGARTGREAAKLLADWINVAVGTQSMEQSPAADNPPGTKTSRLAKQIQSVERFASLDHPVLKAARQLMPR